MSDEVCPIHVAINTIVYMVVTGTGSGPSQSTTTTEIQGTRGGDTDFLLKLIFLKHKNSISELTHVISKYPETSLDGYVYHSLKKLEKWGAVEKKSDGSWTIKKKFD